MAIMEQAKNPVAQPDILPADAFIKAGDGLDDVLCQKRYSAFREDASEIMKDMFLVDQMDDPREKCLLDRQFWSETPDPHNPYIIFQLFSQPHYKAGLPILISRYDGWSHDYTVDYDPETFNNNLEFTLKLRGLDRVEQLVAADDEDGIVVFENHQGRPLSRLEMQEAENITTEQLQQLVETIIAIEERGLKAAEAVYSYHVENGFNLLLLPCSQDPEPYSTAWHWYYPLYNLCNETSEKMDINTLSAFRDISFQLMENYQKCVIRRANIKTSLNPTRSRPQYAAG